MVEINSVDPSFLEKAVKLWAGYENAGFPVREASALASALSEKEVNDLMPLITKLEDDFYQSKAYLIAPSLDAAGTMAARDFKKMHPELPDGIAQVFAWCYTFDYK
jgi:hypothetical protein